MVPATGHGKKFRRQERGCLLYTYVVSIMLNVSYQYSYEKDYLSEFAAEEESLDKLGLLYTSIRFHFTDQDLKQSSDCLFVSTNKSYFVIMSECERNVIQNFYTVDGPVSYTHLDVYKRQCTGS